MRRALIGLVVLGIALAILVVSMLRMPGVQDGLLERGVERLMRVSSDHLFEDDALRVLVCGSSSPLPHPTRAKPCVAVFAGGRFWVVDTGLGSWNRLAGWRISGERIGGILLTHFHSDHIGELGEFDMQTWVAGRPGPLRVYGPRGVERVVKGFEEAYALDAGYRTAHHGAELLPEAVGRMQAKRARPPQGGSVVVLEEDGLTITAFDVNHAPIEPAVGYRFDYKGRSAVVSGDTVKNANLIEVARNADVLVHEAQANHMLDIMREVAEKADRPRVAKILSDIPDYHTTPVEAAEAANEAGVELLVLYHLTPPPPNQILEQIFVRGVDDVRPDDWVMAGDGLLVELPFDSDAIKVSTLE